MLSCGIIGLPTVGKTTLFNLLTGQHIDTSAFFSGKTDVNRGTADIPDARIDALSAMFNPKRTIYAQIEVTEVAGLVRGASSGEGVGNAFLEQVRTADALIQVVRAFKSNTVLHVEETINPARDLETVNFELLMADLEFVEKRQERINAGKKVTPEQKAELEVLAKVQTWLESERPFYLLELSEAERLVLQNYTFLTNKPQVIVVNVDEDQWRAGDYPTKSELEVKAAAGHAEVLMVCEALEVEIAQLPPEERDEFFKELNISEPGINRIARAAYKVLGLQSFFTVGEDEVRAWTIHLNTPAREAAGKIHTDLEKGFIRAEVMPGEKLIELGSVAKVKEQGLLRLEGKDYIVKDGDILNIRFNV